MSDAYTGFAAVYNDLMDDIPYDAWSARIRDILRAEGRESGIVCELGCGTGSLTARLSAAGYDMIGIDSSEDMLDFARESSEDTGILYLCQDMREFELFGTVDAVVSACDSINYITDPADLAEVFRLVNNYLETGGLFVFDIHTDHYYRAVGESTIAEDRDELSFIWNNFYDEDSHINQLDLSLFIREASGLYSKHEETHLQRGYTLSEIRELLAASGMIFLAAYDDYSDRPATDSSDRIVIVAREHTVSGAKKELSDKLGKSS